MSPYLVVILFLAFVRLSVGNCYEKWVKNQRGCVTHFQRVHYKKTCYRIQCSVIEQEEIFLVSVRVVARLD